MRNKKTFKYSMFVALLVPFLAFSLVLAEESVSDEETTMKRRQEMQDQRTRTYKQMKVAEENSEEARVLKEENRKNRLAAAKRMMQAQVNRAQKALDRMDNILERIESRRDKLEDAGLSVTSIDALIAAAKTQKTEADAALEEAKEAVEAITESENPKAALVTFKASIRDLKKETIDLHRSLSNIVKEMKRLARAQTPPPPPPAVLPPPPPPVMPPPPPASTNN